MEEVATPDQPRSIGRRPVWLSILLLLSFTGSMTGLFLALISGVGGQIESFFRTLPVFDTILLEDASGNWIYIVLKVVLFAGSITGVAFMWKLKRVGFWFYLASQVVLLVIPFLFLNKLGFAYIGVRFIMNVIFTLFFIMLYGIQLKRLG
jgi:hypothetical protein